MKLDVEKLEIIMASKMITSKKLSEKSGISYITLSRIKRGVQQPKPITLGKLANALQLDVTEIIKTDK